jgi:hypothetical protein
MMTTTIDTVLRTDEPFREFLASIRSDGGSRGRVAHRVLLLGHGARPCREGVRELIRLRLDWMLEKWVQLYQETVAESIILADLMPTASEMAKLLPKPIPTPKVVPIRVHTPKSRKPPRNPFRYRAEGAPYSNVELTPSGKFKARFGTRSKRYATAIEAASASDSYRRGLGRGLLNFRSEIDSRSANTFVLKEAA